MMASDLYEDEDFPATIASIYYDGRADPGIVWQRPGEICTDPVFSVDGASRFDIAQGELSNCWFLSAVAVLATDPVLFSEIVPGEQGFGDNYDGKFRFRFWRYGEWEEVEVDDRLPTSGGALYFCRNRDAPNEFWTGLIEKAYAKLHGSYQALNFGYSQDALVDLTGGIGEFIDLKGPIGVRQADTEELKAENRASLFRRLKRLIKKKCSFLCASIEAVEGVALESTTDTGLVTGHAYSICAILELTLEGTEHRLIKMRNPWGYREWNGSWSDGSAEWDSVPEENKEELGLTIQNDGEFWMSFDDWTENFDALSLCHMTPDSVHGPYGESLWNTTSHHGMWMRGVSAGGCSLNPATYWQNPQYFVTVVDPDEDSDNKCTLVVSLIQKYTRAMKTVERQEDTEAAIGFDLFKYRGATPEELDGFNASQSALQLRFPMFDFQFLRERSARFELTPGTYCVIPSTYNVDVEGQFLLRLAFERPATTGEVDTPSGIDTSGAADLSDLFDQLFVTHAGADDVVDARELKRILNQGIRRENDEEFSRSTCRALVKQEIGDRRGTMTKPQCEQVWRKVTNLQVSFIEYDADMSGSMNIRELRRALRSAGYRLSRSALASVAQQFCGKSDLLSLDDYVLIATKIASAAAQFEGTSSQAGSGSSSTISLTMDQVLNASL